MKRLFALLLLAVMSPAFAQEYIPQEYTPGPYLPPPPPPGETGNIVYTTVNPPPGGTQFNWTGFINTQSNGGGFSGGNVPAYNPTTGTFLFGYAWGTVTYNIFNSPEWPSSGINVDGFKYSWEYFNQDMSSGTLFGNISFFSPTNSLLESFNFQMPSTTEGWTLFDGQIDFVDSYDRSEIGRLQISFTGKDSRFWAGYYGPQLRDIDVSIQYSTPPPPPPDFLYWKRLAGENELFTLTEPGVVRYGADGVYLYQEFQAGTYACSNGDWGSDPIGGVVKSCEFGSNIAPPVAEVNCVTDPTDPSCIIDSITNDAVDQIILADTGSDTGSDDGSDAFTEEEEPAVDPVTEEALAAEEVASEEIIEEDIEEMLAEEEAADEEAATETIIVAKTLENEEKASVLSDSISKDVLEAALSIAADVTAAGSVAGSDSTSSSTASTSSSSRSTNETAEAVVAEIQSASDASSSEVAVAANEGDASAELLETGRVMGQEALAATLAGTEASANESMAEAESVASTSSETSMVASSDSSIATTQSEEVAATEEIQTQESNVVVAEVAETTTETVVAETMTQAETSAEISFDVGREMMAENAQQTATAEAQEAEALNVAAAAASSEQKFDDESAKDAETTNALVDPAFAMANTFNQAPNMMSLEFLGVLKPIEKSDAEIRAEQVVAANKEQQDAINANYMDADQSGIVAAIGAEADVSSYLSQRLQDAPFYKPEDIYKNIVIKDNVRGSYFLEKGNTDTYKKMVEEQYK